MYTGKRHETPGPEARHSNDSSQSILIFLCCFLEPHFLLGDEVRMGWLKHTVDSLQDRNPEFREPKSSIMGCKYTHLNFVLGRGIIFIMLDNKQTCPPLQRETSLYLPLMFAKYRPPWKDSLEQRLSVPHLQDMQKHERPVKNYIEVIQSFFTF